MPSMSGAERDRENVAAMQAEIQRLDALPLNELAAEVMIRGFGPGRPGGPGEPGTIEDPVGARRIGLEHFAREFTPAFADRGVGPELNKRLMNLIAEGLQILENTALVRVSYRGNSEHWFATRRGRQAVARGELERILDTGLRY